MYTRCKEMGHGTKDCRNKSKKVKKDHRDFSKMACFNCNQVCSFSPISLLSSLFSLLFADVLELISQSE